MIAPFVYVQAAVQSPIDLREIVQYVSNAVTVGLFIFVMRTNSLLTEIRTILSGDFGLINRLKDHETRIRAIEDYDGNPPASMRMPTKLDRRAPSEKD